MPIENSLTPEEIQAVQAKIDELLALEGSQAKLGRRLGVSQQAISKAIAGEVGFALARKVARELSVTFDELVGRSPLATVKPATARGASVSGRQDFGVLSTEDLAELVQALGVRQLRDVIDRHPQISSHSVELAEAAHALAARMRRREAPRGREEEEAEE